MPITAGVMDIINGIGGIIVGTAFLTILRISALYSSSNAISGYLILLAGILSILGGIYSFKREKMDFGICRNSGFYWPLNSIHVLILA